MNMISTSCGELAYVPRFFDNLAQESVEAIMARKRIFDIVLSSLIMICASPLVMAAMLLVRLTSSGPVIYTQTRLGRGGRPFTIYKIRTMQHNCELMSGIKWATPRDPRVTFLGRILRRTHIDELPQLWNVLCGEMSLVGPRPERPVIAEQLRKAIVLYDERLRIRPGLTGLAQVQLAPDSNIAGVTRKLACDLHYIRNRGLWLDLRLLVSTALGVCAIPFAVSRLLLRIPDMSAARSTYEELLAQAGDPAATDRVSVGHAQGAERHRSGQALETLISEPSLTPPALAN